MRKQDEIDLLHGVESRIGTGTSHRTSISYAIMAEYALTLYG